MSRLSRLAQAASDYMRRRLLSELAGIFRGQNSGAATRRPSVWEQSRPGAPPIIGGSDEPPRRPPTTGNAPSDDDEQYDDVTLLGRDMSHDAGDWQEVNARMRIVSSSNVYGYFFQQESPTMGILYVQYLNWTPKQFGGDGSRSGEGAVYAYYDVPTAKFREFESQAASSAGRAVWEYLRVPGSRFEHQHTYRLISTSGPYVPRKATAKGYKARNTAGIGSGMRRGKGERARQQLEPRKFAFRRVLPNREPYRGLPNRGEPNRGR